MRAPIKPVFVIVPVLVSVLAAPSARAAASASGDIDSVVVFADRARVTRARTVPCEKGTARAVFERLPDAIDTRTLRGEVREAAEVLGLSGEQVNEGQEHGEGQPARPPQPEQHPLAPGKPPGAPPSH